METLREWLGHQFDKKPRLNQTALAITIGVGQSTVSKWMNGAATPDPENCHKLARFFDVAEEQVLILAGHFQPRVIGNGNCIAESRTPYHIGPRAHLDQLLDQLTDDQVELLTQFLEGLRSD